MLLGTIGTILLIPAAFLTKLFDRKFTVESSKIESVKHTEQSRNLHYLPDINGVNDPHTV